MATGSSLVEEHLFVMLQMENHAILRVNSYRSHRYSDYSIVSGPGL